MAAHCNSGKNVEDLELTLLERVDLLKMILFPSATWNLCLGIANKKEIVTDCLNENNIQVCCLQETEINQGFPEEILNCNNYILELEMNTTKKGTGIYLNKNVKYIRRRDLERENMHIVIVDVTIVKCIIIINPLKGHESTSYKTMVIVIVLVVF